MWCSHTAASFVVFASPSELSLVLGHRRRRHHTAIATMAIAVATTAVAIVVATIASVVFNTNMTVNELYNG